MYVQTTNYIRSYINWIKLYWSKILQLDSTSKNPFLRLAARLALPLLRSLKTSRTGRGYSMRPSRFTKLLVWSEIRHKFDNEYNFQACFIWSYVVIQQFIFSVWRSSSSLTRERMSAATTRPWVPRDFSVFVSFPVLPLAYHCHFGTSLSFGPAFSRGVLPSLRLFQICRNPWLNKIEKFDSFRL